MKRALLVEGVSIIIFENERSCRGGSRDRER